MGKLVKFLSPVAGLLGGSKSPKASTTASADTEEASRKAKKSRTALLETEGGVAGQELEAGAVTQRNSLLGN